MLWLHIGDTDPSKGDSTDMRNTLCFEWITMMHKASLDKRKKHVYCISKATPSSLKEWWNCKKRPVDGSYSVKISWAQEISSHPCDFTAELRIPLLSVQHRKGGQDVCWYKLPTWSEKHHETSPSEAQTAQGHPPEGVLSLYDMGLCLQSHFGRFWGFFLADSPQRVKLQKRNSQRRTCLPQNLRGTKTRWLDFQRPKEMGQEVPNITKGVSDSRSVWLKIHEWKMIIFCSSQQVLWEQKWRQLRTSNPL